MFGKNPYELPLERKFSKMELSEAIRISMIAELDAINLYLQFARAIDDERYKKVFEDIAKEEKTHLGEFLALLKTLDAEQVAEIATGQKEVAELTSLEIPKSNLNSDPEESWELLSKDEWNMLTSSFKETLSITRKIREHLPRYEVGRGIDAVSFESIDPMGSRKMQIIQLCELCVDFSILQRTIDSWRRMGSPPDLSSVIDAAMKLAMEEDNLLLWGRKDQGINGLATIDGAIELKISDWSTPGSAVDEVYRAISELLKSGAPPPYVLLLSPGRYVRLLMVHERTGIMELTRVKALVKDVVQVPMLPDNLALVISVNPSFIDMVIGADLVIDYIGPENGKHKFRAWETVALRIKNPKAIAHLKQ